MSVFERYRQAVGAALDALAADGAIPPGLSYDAVTAQPPRDPSHGDVSTNAAMVLAKAADRKPRALAEALTAKLTGVAGVASVDIAGPGFINLRLDDDVWRNELWAILRAGTEYGRSDLGRGEPVNVEYVSANPTGPLHVGHVRGAVVGDALASLLEFTGHAVTREYYINDAGAQVDALARSAYLRYVEALTGEPAEIPDGLYPGDYLIPVGEALVRRYGGELLEMQEGAWLPIARETAIEMMMALIKDDLGVLSIHHDVFFSEHSLANQGHVDAVLRDLEAAGHIYVGTLEPPKGKAPEDWEPRPQTLFRATEFGDDVDRPLKKSDGSWTYFAADIAYHANKVERGGHTLIDVWGADHGGYIKRMQAAVKAVTGGRAALDVKLCQIVRLFRAGEPVRMSKRSGSFVTLREVVDEVGPDVVRFMMLTRKNDAQLDFDFAKVTDESKDNPVFYVQYAHARICSNLRMALSEMPDLACDDETLANVSLAVLADPSEIALARKAAEFPRVIEGAARAHEPHRIAFYLYDLAAAYHAHYNRGKEEPSLRFVVSGDVETTHARLALIRSVAIVIAAGLRILGVKPVTEM